MAFAIKAEVRDPQAETFAFTAQKTMYGGTQIAEGDMVFVFASENEGGKGLIARGIVTSAEAVAKTRGLARQTPCVSITVRCTALAKRSPGRNELKHFSDWSDGQPGTELISSFIARPRTRLWASRTTRRPSSADSFSPGARPNPQLQLADSGAQFRSRGHFASS